MTRWSSFAPAKINLTLRVGPPRADGLHPLDSVIAFADVGDTVVAEDAESLLLSVAGPFAPALAGEIDNLVVRAARALAAEAGVAPRAALMLEKRLPIASGIGGGSSDAAAALRCLDRLWRTGAGADDLERLARALGADVPVCVRAAAARMRGVGDVLAPLALPSLYAVLVNPGVPSPTGAVYRAFDALPAAPDWKPDEPPVAGEALGPWLAAGRNDLTEPAIQVAPETGDALAALALAAPGAPVRVSGSGATCFALARDADHAARIAATVDRPGWWVVATRLGDVDVEPKRG